MKNNNPRSVSLTEEYLHSDLLGSLVDLSGETHVRHWLCWSHFPVYPMERCTNNTMVNLKFLDRRKSYKQLMGEKDYNGVLLLLDKQLQMQWFIKNHKRIYRDLGELQYYKMLRSCLTHVDSHDHLRKDYPKLIRQGNKPSLMMSGYERRQYVGLPNQLVVYRGVSSGTRVNHSNLKDVLGNSWSLDREIAIWFAKYHSPKFRASKYLVLLRYSLKKEEIVAYFKDRGEEEVFLDHSRIDLNRITIQYIPKRYKPSVRWAPNKN